jgi:hypothetical protein
MGRLGLLALVVVGAGAQQQRVELRATNNGEPGVLEIRGADGGIAWSGYLERDLEAEVPASDRFELRLRRDAGDVRAHVDPAAGVFRMTVNAERYYLAVSTYEAATDVSLEVTRVASVAPTYTLTNRGDQDLAVLPWVWANDVGYYTECLVSGGRLRPHERLALGPIDEACLLEDARVVKVMVETQRIDSERFPSRQRTFIVQHDVRANEKRGRWIPDAGSRLLCICGGTELGPTHDVVLHSEFGTMTLKSRDGGVRVERMLGDEVRMGDHPPFVLPPGAWDDPDFSEWQQAR